MAPSSLKKISAAVACATAVRAATESYQLSEEYTADNFFDKFDFFTSTYTSGDSWDDTHGYVHYRDQADAESLGLISTSSEGIYIGPDTNSTYDPAGKGRDSVRITSKAMYNEGLMIAKFSHMPVQACGAWPAFWSFGSPWLTLGEIDYFEGWNLMEFNRMAMHTNKTIAGECSLTTTGIEGTVMTQDCNNAADGTGCGVKDDSGVWSSLTGATFAMEWTDSAIKVWSWLPSAVPSDITAGTPDPSSSAWGNPTLLLEQTNCDLSKSFGNQQLVFNIDFCGDTAGSPTFWNETCSALVGDSCANYVANTPSAFAETYFMIEGIQYYEMGVATASVTASAALVSSTATSTAAGLLVGAGSVLESTLGATSTSSQDAAVTEAVQPAHHTTSYIYGTSTSTDEFGSETTVVVVVDTTICPVTAAEASQSSVLPTDSSVAVAAQTTPASQTVATATDSPSASRTPLTTLTSYSTSTLTSTATLTSTSTSTSLDFTTSTIFSTSSSTITSCASTASASCSVGDVTTVVIAVSTTICPVTAAEASASQKASSIVASASSAFSIPASGSGSATSENSPVQATASADLSLSAATSKSTALSTRKSTLTAAAAASATSASSKASTMSIYPTTEVISATETGGGLEVATGTPTSISLEWMTQATAAASVAAYGGSNGTVTSSSASASQTNSCSALDCIVVSSSGSKMGTVGASGLALVVGAGAMLLF